MNGLNTSSTNYKATRPAQILNSEKSSESYAVNTFEDMQLIKETAKTYNIDIPPLIVTSFDTQRYTECDQFIDYDCPDIVANIFLDHAKDKDDVANVSEHKNLSNMYLFFQIVYGVTMDTLTDDRRDKVGGVIII